MLYVRLVVPPAVSAQVVRLLVEDPRVTNVVVHPGAALNPVGDAVALDVAREGASDVLGRLRDLGLDDTGGVTVQSVEASPSRNARAAQRAAPGSPDDGVVWDVVTEWAYDGARPSFAFYAFMALATTIAAVAVVTDSPILVVGAMVVGPEFAAVAAVCVGVVQRERRLVAGGLWLLVSGFAAAVVGTTILALVAAWLGWVDAGQLLAPRPLTGFIWKPEKWSFVVALLAGCAGMLSQTTGRSTALVGVFISVTTIPAAGNFALALALRVPSEMGGAAAQLGVNLAGMTLAGILTLLVLRRAPRSVGRPHWARRAAR